MRQTAAFIVIFLISLTSYSLNQEDKNIWARTGYGLPELYSEFDFAQSNCLSNAKLYSACLMTLNYMLGMSETQPKTIVFDGVSELTIVDKPIPVKSLTYEEALKEASKTREVYALAWQMQAKESFSNVYFEAKDKITESNPEYDLASVAGVGYGVFLHEAYDPRTSFVPREKFYPAPEKYFGIGAHIIKYEDPSSPYNGGVTVRPMPGMPAYEAGLRTGDLILAIDGESVVNETLDYAAEKLKGLRDSVVQLKVHSLCANEVKDVELKRGGISSMPDWVAESRFVSLEDGDLLGALCSDEKQKPKAGTPQALYMPLTTFQPTMSQSICSEFIGLQIKDLRNPDSVGLILDLRNNVGGSLEEVSCMLNSLVSSNEAMVGMIDVEKGKIKEGATIFNNYVFSTVGKISDEGKFIHYNKNIIVLVNGLSASASEIFAGTIQDMQRGWVIGERTLGKGSVQRYMRHQIDAQYNESGDQPIMLGKTIALYTLNSGRSPQGVGIIPDLIFNNLGESVTYGPDYISTESKSFNSIQYDQEPWSQARPQEVSELQNCAQAPGTLSQGFKRDLSQDERYGRPFVADYQLELAKDALVCSPKRPEVL